MVHQVSFRAIVGVVRLTSCNGFFMSNSSLGMLNKNVFHILKRKKEKAKIFRPTHKVRFNVSCAIFLWFQLWLYAGELQPLLGWLVRFIHPGFDTWCRPATATKKNPFSCSCDVAQEEPRGAWRFTPLNRLFEVRSDDILVLSSYRFFKFEACYSITVCHLDSLQEVRGGSVSGFKKSVTPSVCRR